MKRKAEILTHEEIMRLLATFSRRPTGVRNAAMVTVMWRAGLRSREVVTLLLRDIGRDRIHVREAKGGKERYVPIDSQAMMFVRYWVNVRATLPHVRSQLLFCTHAGNSIDTSYLRHMLDRKAKEAGITKRVHPHALRHTYASELDRERVPLAEIRDLLGHNSVQTTAVYISRAGSQQLADRIASRPPWLSDDGKLKKKLYDVQD